MSRSDPRTPPDDAGPAPAWGTAPGAAGSASPRRRHPALRSPRRPQTAANARPRRPRARTDGAARAGPTLGDGRPRHGVPRRPARRGRPRHRGHDGALGLGARGLALPRRRSRRAHGRRRRLASGHARRAGATRALVALLAGTVVVTTWVAVDVVPATGPGYGVGSSLRGYPLGGGSDDGPEITAVSDRVWFGESVRYADGLVVSVSAPQAYTPSEHAAVRDGDPPDSVRVRVRLTNGTGRAVDPGASTCNRCRAASWPAGCTTTRRTSCSSAPISWRGVERRVGSRVRRPRPGGRDGGAGADVGELRGGRLLLVTPLPARAGVTPCAADTLARAGAERGRATRPARAPRAPARGPGRAARARSGTRRSGSS